MIMIKPSVLSQSESFKGLTLAGAADQSPHLNYVVIAGFTPLFVFLNTILCIKLRSPVRKGLHVNSWHVTSCQITQHFENTTLRTGSPELTSLTLNGPNILLTYILPKWNTMKWADWRISCAPGSLLSSSSLHCWLKYKLLKTKSTVDMY